MRRFYLNRKSDPTGVSGTGYVADGVLFDDGVVVIRWRGEHRTTTVHTSLESVKAIHLHVGATEIVWIDPICFACGAVLELFELRARHCHECGAGQGTEDDHLEELPDPKLGKWKKALTIGGQS